MKLMLLFMLLIWWTGGCDNTRSGSENEDPSGNPPGAADQDDGDADTGEGEEESGATSTEEGEEGVSSEDASDSESSKEQHQRLLAQSSAPVSVSSGTCYERGVLSHNLQFRRFSKSQGGEGLVCDLLSDRTDGTASAVYFAQNNPTYCETQGLQDFISKGAGRGRTCQKFVGPQRPAAQRQAGPSPGAEAPPSPGPTP